MPEKKTDSPAEQTALVIKENEQLKGLEESKAKQIKAVFAPMIKMLENFEEKYKEVTELEISPDKCKRAKRLRIDISKVRTEADKVRKTQKEEYLRAGNAIQGVYNILKYAVADKEEKLKDIETHYERIEEAKKEQLQIDRQAELEKYEADGEFIDLGNMPDEVWKNYFAGVKNNYESIKVAERKAEEERIERERIYRLDEERRSSILNLWQFMPEENKNQNFGEWAEDMWDELVNYLNLTKADYDKEQAKIKADNERLRIEAEKAEKKRIADQKKTEAERIKQEEKLKAEREAQEKKLRAEREKAEAEKRIQDEIIRREREAREKLEREAREKEEANWKEAERQAAEERKAAAAPDKEKLFSVAAKLRNTKTTVKSPKAIQALEDAAMLLEKVAEVM